MKKLFFTLAVCSISFASDASWLVNYHINKSGISDFNTRLFTSAEMMSRIANEPGYYENLLFKYNKDMCDDKDDLQACNKAGNYLYNNKDYKSAITWYEYTCSKNIGSGCAGEGNSYYALKNYKKANIAYTKGCKLNNGVSCNNLAWAYEQKLGKKLNYKLAKEFYAKACKLKNAVGCDNLGWMYKNGKGVAKNAKTAKKYHKLACDMGYQDGCENYNDIK